MSSDAQLKPFTERRTLGNSRWYAGGLITFFATGEQTGGQFALFEAAVRRGEEIPAHTHSKEDESFFILDGEIAARVGSKIFRARKGDFVFLPRNVKHTWKSVADHSRFLVLITPAGFERTFLAFSEPATSMGLPSASKAPSEDFMRRLMEMESDYGVVYEFQEQAEQGSPPA